MKLVCLDNNILIWGIRKKATTGQEDHIRRAAALFKELDESSAQIMVPTPVLSEFLTFIPEQQQDVIVASFSRHFQLTPFDVHAAATAAKIWRSLAAENVTWKDAVKAEVEGLIHARIKYDIQILAIAISRRAEVLYTHDKGLMKLAEGRIEVKTLPPPFSG